MDDAGGQPTNDFDTTMVATEQPLTPEDKRAIASIRARTIARENGVSGIAFAHLLRAEGSAGALTLEEQTGVFERVGECITRGVVDVVFIDGPPMTTDEALVAVANLTARLEAEGRIEVAA